jgi:hypothetical protein
MPTVLRPSLARNTSAKLAATTSLAAVLQLGDPGGHIRRALARFPYADVSEQILDRYVVEGGIDPEEPFCSTPRFFALTPPTEVTQGLASGRPRVLSSHPSGHAQITLRLR